MEAPRSPLAGRYRFTTNSKTADGTVRWSAIDVESGAPVLCAVVPGQPLAALEAVRGEKHLHLAAVLDVVRDPEAAALPPNLRMPQGGAVAVVELVPGQTLRGALKRGKIHPFKAVAWVLRLADALGTLHKQGSVHGSISPRSVVVEPVGRAIAPVLAQLVAPPLAAFCSPERLAGGGPCQEDDVWALHALLYAALMGSVPFAGNGDELASNIRRGLSRQLAEQGIDEPALERLLQQGLAADPSQRTSDLESLAAALDAWERGKEPLPPAPRPPRSSEAGPHVVELFFDDGMLPDDDGVEGPHGEVHAPVVPPGAAPLAPTPPAPEAQPVVALPVPRDAGPVPPVQTAPLAVAAVPRPALKPEGGVNKLYLALGAGALLVAAVVTGVVLSSGSSDPAQPETPSAEAPAETADEPAPAPAAPEPSKTEQVALCVKTYFADRNVAETNFDFVCGNEDFREVSTRVFQAVTPKRDPTAKREDEASGIVVTGTGSLGDLGWFELAATAIMRTTCCRGAQPVTLPQTSGWCQQLQGEVRGIAEASKKPVDLSPYARKFEDAVLCLYATGTKRPYRYEGAPNAQHTQAFQRFLKAAAESEAQRSRMKWLSH
jgi:hypothetical protein